MAVQSEEQRRKETPGYIPDPVKGKSGAINISPCCSRFPAFVMLAVSKSQKDSGPAEEFQFRGRRDGGDLESFQRGAPPAPLRSGR